LTLFCPFFDAFLLESLVINHAGLNADRIDDDEGRIGVVHALLQKPQDAFLRFTYTL
jgi:hypothetical protein